MILAPVQYHSFGEAFRHADRSLGQQGGSVGLFSRLRGYFHAITQSSRFVGHGVTTLDVLIAGPDYLLNLLLAHRAAMQGKRVGIYHGKSSEWEQYDRQFDARISNYHPSFAGVISQQIGIYGLGRTLEQAVDQICLHLDAMTDESGSPMVVQLDGCQLNFSGVIAKSGHCRFWVDPGYECFNYPSLERYMFWMREWVDEYHSEGIELPHHTLETSKVCLTGTPVQLPLVRQGRSVERWGEASRPSSHSGYMTAQERMRDILEVLGACGSNVNEYESPLMLTHQPGLRVS